MADDETREARIQAHVEHAELKYKLETGDIRSDNEWLAGIAKELRSIDGYCLEFSSKIHDQEITQDSFHQKTDQVEAHLFHINRAINRIAMHTSWLAVMVTIVVAHYVYTNYVG